MEWLILALLTPFFWSFTNIFDRILTSRYLNPMDYMIIGGFTWLANLVFFPWSNLKVISLTFILLVIFIGLLRIFAFLFYLKAMQIEEASRVTPLGNLSTLFILIMSTVFLKEILTKNQLIAFFLILVGAFMLSTRKIKGLFKLRKALWFILINTVIWAVSYVLLKFAYNYVTLWDALVLIAIGEAVGCVFILLNKKLRNSFVKNVKGYKRNVWLLIAVSSFFAFIGGVTSSAAIMLGPVSLVSVVGGFQGLIVFVWAIFLSRFFPKILKEELDKKVLLTKAIAIILMIVGLWFLYM